MFVVGAEAVVPVFKLDYVFFGIYVMYLLGGCLCLYVYLVTYGCLATLVFPCLFVYFGCCRFAYFVVFVLACGLSFDYAVMYVVFKLVVLWGLFWLLFGCNACIGLL